jgi:FixJ family two-component response regulator
MALSTLTDRELELLQLLIAGQTNKEIASALIVSSGISHWMLSVYFKYAGQFQTVEDSG